MWFNKLKSRENSRKILSLRFGFFLIVGIFLQTCAKPEDDPGTCKLTCGDAIIGGSDLMFESVYEIKSASCPNVDYGNAYYLAVDAPVTLQFRAYKSAKVNGVEKKIPVGGISFQPLIGGAMNSDKTHESNKTDSGVYDGIVTPKSDWCTDSCGVGSITVQPVCIKGNDNEVSVMLRSGSLYTNTVSFAFKAPSTE